MDVVVQIQGRDALPVRAVPFAGRWQWMSSPDGIASACSQKPITAMKFETEHRGEEKEIAVRNREYLPSFVLLSDGAVRQLHPDEWSFCAVEIKGLESKLRGEELVEDGNFAPWRRQAIEKLPAGVFVWLDDFKRWMAYTCPPDCSEQEEDDELIEEPTLQPLVPPELEGVLFEGFRSSGPRNRRNDEKSFASLSSALAAWFETPFDDLPGEQWYRVKTDFWPMPWDALSPNQRREVAAQWDYSHDPEMEDEHQQSWDLFCRQDAVQREIREWEALKPQSITEKAQQTDRLLALREQERLLRVQLSSDAAGSSPKEQAPDRAEAKVITQGPVQPVGVELEPVQGQGEPISTVLTPMKRKVIISTLARQYPALESDFNRSEKWVQECNTGKRGEYYFEKIKQGCVKKWGASEPIAPIATIRTNRLR